MPAVGASHNLILFLFDKVFFVFMVSQGSLLEFRCCADCNARSGESRALRKLLSVSLIEGRERRVRYP